MSPMGHVPRVHSEALRGGLHAVSQIDPAQLPPLGEPIPRRRPAPRCSLFGCGRQAARPLGHQALPVRRDDLGPRNPASPWPYQTFLRARFQCPTQAAGWRSAAP